MSASVDEIVKIIEALQQRPTGSLAVFENVLAEIGEYLERIAKAAEAHEMPMPEKPEQEEPMQSMQAADGSAIAQSIADALRGLQITAPPVHVEIAAPQVTVQASSEAAVKSWTFAVQRDEMGRITNFRATPEV